MKQYITFNCLSNNCIPAVNHQHIHFKVLLICPGLISVFLCIILMNYTQEHTSYAVNIVC
jgi:hypothetical protein